MKYHFDGLAVRRLLSHSQDAVEHRLLYENAATDRPGLWLVSDEGVYLFSNGMTWLSAKPVPEGTEPLFVYALECDPSTLSFDIWWRAKREGFGNDDGIAFLPAEHLVNALKLGDPTEPVAIEISGDDIIIHHQRPKPAPDRRRRRRKRA